MRSEPSLLRRAIGVIAAAAVTFMMFAVTASTPAQAQWTDCKLKCMQALGSCDQPCGSPLKSTSEIKACTLKCSTDYDKCVGACDGSGKPKH